MKTLSKLALLVAGTMGSFSAQSAPPLNNIVGNWHLDESRGQRVFDSSGYSKHGILGDTASVELNDPLWVSRRFDNAALSFDGAHFVKVAHSSVLEPKKISVEAWVKAEPTSDDTVLPYVVAKSGNKCESAAYAIYLRKDSAGNLGVPYFYIHDGVSYVESPEGAASLWDGKWHHLVGTYDQKAVRLYVDGVQIGTGTPSTAPIAYSNFNNKDLYIGDYDGISDICTDYNGNYVGQIDEVRIWNKALNAIEVDARFKGY